MRNIFLHFILLFGFLSLGFMFGLTSKCHSSSNSWTFEREQDLNEAVMSTYHYKTLAEEWQKRAKQEKARYLFLLTHGKKGRKEFDEAMERR